MSLERFTARLQAEAKAREHGQFFNGLGSFSHIALEIAAHQPGNHRPGGAVAENGDQLGIKPSQRRCGSPRNRT